MEAHERYLKITELLNKFKNGEELYKKSPLFNQAIQVMVEGQSVYDVLEQIVLAAERTNHAFEDYVYRDTRPIYIPDLNNQT